MDDLPGLDCGVCGLRTCKEMASRLETDPEFIKRCIYLSDNRFEAPRGCHAKPKQSLECAHCTGFDNGRRPAGDNLRRVRSRRCGLDRFHPRHEQSVARQLGREFDFYLEHFPEEPGPREIILPHNPLITREMDIQVGDILIGRPLGMSCGCPITHCGVTMSVDKRTGVIVWCVTGPLNPRQKGFKDLGYYIAEGYEGLINERAPKSKLGCVTSSSRACACCSGGTAGW